MVLKVRATHNLLLSWVLMNLTSHKTWLENNFLVGLDSLNLKWFGTTLGSQSEISELIPDSTL